MTFAARYLIRCTAAGQEIGRRQAIGGVMWPVGFSEDSPQNERRMFSAVRDKTKLSGADVYSDHVFSS